MDCGGVEKAGRERRRLQQRWGCGEVETLALKFVRGTQSGVLTNCWVCRAGGVFGAAQTDGFGDQQSGFPPAQRFPEGL